LHLTQIEDLNELIILHDKAHYDILSNCFTRIL